MNFVEAQESQKNPKKKISCRYCNLDMSTYSNRSRHEKKCKISNNEMDKLRKELETSIIYNKAIEFDQKINDVIKEKEKIYKEKIKSDKEKNRYLKMIERLTKRLDSVTDMAVNKSATINNI